MSGEPLCCGGSTYMRGLYVGMSMEDVMNSCICWEPNFVSRLPCDLLDLEWSKALILTCQYLDLNSILEKTIASQVYLTTLRSLNGQLIECL